MRGHRYQNCQRQGQNRCVDAGDPQPQRATTQGSPPALSLLACVALSRALQHTPAAHLQSKPGQSTQREGIWKELQEILCEVRSTKRSPGKWPLVMVVCLR